jgi:hypothetical protein
MKENLVRISKVNHPHVAKSTLYKWKHLRKFPGLFVKFSGMLLVDLDELDNILEAGRLQ